jgi:hypothetical protein
MAMAVPVTATPARRRTARVVKPFTIAHFRRWAADLILDTGDPWHPEPFQEAFVEDVFSGAPECWLIVPEGNGKTTLIAGLALYHCEFRPFANVPVAASSREQAELVYRQAEGFVLRSPRMYETSRSATAAAKGKRKTDVPRFLCLEGYRRINHHEGGRIQVFAADDRTGDGVIPTLGILDELHRHRNLALYRTWAGKLLKRQGQIVTISTAGEPGSEFEMTRERIRQHSPDVTRKGSFLRAVAPRLRLHEWAVPEDGDVEDMAVVKAANPLSTLTPQVLAEKRATDTMTLSHWRRFSCNLPTRADDAAITEAEWSAARTDETIPAGVPIWLGLKVTWKWNTTALVPYLMPEPTKRLFGPAVVLTPPKDGNSLDPALVEAALLELHEHNPIHTVVMAVGRAEQLAAWIADTLGAEVVDQPHTIPQSVEEYDDFMEALRNGWLHHAGDEGLTTHALNAIAKVLPSGAARFDQTSASHVGLEQERRVIDALIAASMVHSAALVPVPQLEPLVRWA